MCKTKKKDNVNITYHFLALTPLAYLIIPIIFDVIIHI